MKVMIASFNDGTETWNAEAEETEVISYTLDHQMDQPCVATVTIADPTGTKAQKYNTDVNDNYLGPSKITIEDPTGTDIFYGRILRADAIEGSDMVTLICEDWLSQLDDQQIDYDMREDLDGSGLRVSSLLPDWDETDGVGGIRPAFDAGGGTIYLYDNHRIYAADAWNGMNLVFTDAIAGKKTWRTGPYDEIVTLAAGTGAGDNDSGNESDLWLDDDNAHAVWDNDEGWTQDYLFRVYLGDETGTINDNYVLGSLTGARVHVVYSLSSTVDDAYGDFQIQVDTDADGTLDTYYSLGKLDAYDSDLGTIKTVKTFEIPSGYFNGDIGDAIVSSGGIGRVRFNVNWVSNTAYLYVYYIYFEVDVETTGMSDVASISDGETYRLTVNVDFADPSKKVWTGCTYSIAQFIYQHLEAATGPILGYDSIVTLTAGAANIENTSGVSTRYYVNKTPLEIIQDLARQDKAHFWIALGGSTVTYQSTFGADTDTLSDSEVIGWQMRQDYTKLVNKATVFGMRIGEQQLSASYSDATSIDVFQTTRTTSLTDTGLSSEADCLAKATAIVNQQKAVQKMLVATIAGNTATAAHATTIKLGDVIEVTSSRFGVTAVDYVVQRFKYDLRSNVTTLTLHPKNSTVGMVPLDSEQPVRAMQKARRGSTDLYAPQPQDVT